MSSAIIYKINKKGYLLHADRKTISGFYIASNPFIQITEITTNAIASAVKKVLSADDDTRVADPKNWSEFNKDFLKKTGLKSSKELHKETTFCCVIRKENESIIFTPTKHEKKPEEGFSHKSKKEENAVPYTASDEEIFQAFELALSKCE